MGRLRNGIFGPFDGKIGGLVGSSRNGVHYVKSVPVRTRPFTPAELANQHRFRVSEAWINPLLFFLKVGFNNDTPKRGRNAAKSYLLKNAMEGSGMEITVRPDLMKVSEGNLPLSEGITVTTDEDLNLRFNWSITQVAQGNVRDQIMMLAYDIEQQMAYFTTAGNFRFIGTDILFIPKEAHGKPLHIYAAFSGHDRQDQSDSVYLGAVTIV